MHAVWASRRWKPLIQVNAAAAPAVHPAAAGRPSARSSVESDPMLARSRLPTSVVLRGCRNTQCSGGTGRGPARSGRRRFRPRDRHGLRAPPHSGLPGGSHGDRDRPGAYRNDPCHRHPRARAVRAGTQRPQRSVPFRTRHDFGPWAWRQPCGGRDRRHSRGRRLRRGQLCGLGPRLRGRGIRRPGRVPARTGVVAVRQRRDRGRGRDDHAHSRNAADAGRGRIRSAHRRRIRLRERWLACGGARGRSDR